MGFDQALKVYKGGYDEFWFDFFDNALQSTLFHIKIKEMMVLAKALFGKNRYQKYHNRI